MRSVGNDYIEKLEFLPDEIELTITQSWCYSVISTMEKMESYEELIYMINACICNSDYTRDSTRNVPKYVKMRVGDIKKIINICGMETLCYVLPYNYLQLSSDFLYDKLGDLKDKIEVLVGLGQYDEALDLINNLNDIDLKILALKYVKYIYAIHTENKINLLKRARKSFINKINSIIETI